MPNNSPLPHALVIGGTGMMRTVSEHIAKTGFLTTVIARNNNRLAKLSGTINTISVDYTKTQETISLIKDSINHFGPIQLVVSWIHSTAPNLVKEIAQLVSNQEKPADFYEIFGNRNPAGLNISGIVYHKIILGGIKSNFSTRWLTNGEIGSGIIKAIRGKDSVKTLGEILKE